MKKINFKKLSPYDKFHLMMAVSDYADGWDFVCWDRYRANRTPEDLEGLFQSLSVSSDDWELFVARWKTCLLRCWERGRITLSADDACGCSYDLTVKIVAGNGWYSLLECSNVCDPIGIGVCVDLGTALYNAVMELGCHIRNWAYQPSLEGLENED